MAPIYGRAHVTGAGVTRSVPEVRLVRSNFTLRTVGSVLVQTGLAH